MYIYGISVILKFHGGEFWKKYLKRLLREAIMNQKWLRSTELKGVIEAEAGQVVRYQLLRTTARTWILFLVCPEPRFRTVQTFTAIRRYDVHNESDFMNCGLQRSQSMLTRAGGSESPRLVLISDRDLFLFW